MKATGTVLAIALLGNSSSSREPITFYGVGLVKVGSTVEAASKAVGQPLRATPDRGEEPSCHFVQLKSKPGLLFMVEDGHITRAETDDRRYPTAGGVRVGDSEARVRAIYGARLEIEEHKYDPTGHNLTVRSADGRFALVMETDGKKVVYIRAGQMPSAEYVEGCL